MRTKAKVNLGKKKISVAYNLGIPLIILIVDIKLNDPFSVPKLIVLTLISAWLAVEIGFLYSSNKSKLGKREKIILFTLITFLGSLFTATVLSDNLTVALLGETQRRNGLISYLGLTVILIYGMKISSINGTTNLFGLALVASVPVMIYSAIQISGHDFIAWVNPYNNAIATLGNPNFTSAYLGIMIVLAVGYMFSQKFTYQRVFFLLLLVLIALFIIISSESRQGLYALVVGLLLYVNLLVLKYRARFSWILIPFTIFLAALGTAGMLQKGPLSSILYKESVSVRGFYWRAGIEMFLDNPIWGVGVDSYGRYFRQFKEIQYVQRFGTELTSTNAHNVFIQMFSTSGLLVGLSYCVLVVLTFFAAFQFIFKQKQHNQHRVMIALISAYATFQAQSFISIDNLALGIWGYVISGAILGISLNNSDSLQVSSQYAHNNNFGFSKPIFRFLLILPIFYLSIMIRNSEADSYTLRSITNPSITDNRGAVQISANKIIDNFAADPFLKLKAASYLLDMGLTNEAYSVIEKLTNSDPNNYENLWYLANIQYNNGEVDKAIATRLKISSIDKFNTRNHLLLMSYYKEKNNVIEMEKRFDKIMDIAPTSEDAKNAKALLGA